MAGSGSSPSHPGSLVDRTSCPAYHSCPAFPVSIFLNNLYTPLHCHYCLPGILLKGLLTFNPCPVPCCPSCLLSCLSQLIYSAKELYPNTQFNIIVLVFIFEFWKLIITCVIDCFSWTYCPRGSVLIVLFILSGCPVLGILCYTCALLLSFLSWFPMTSHNTCLTHLPQERSFLSNHSRPYGCPVICSRHSRCPGCPVMSALSYLSCLASFGLFSFPSNALHSVFQGISIILHMAV